MTERFAGRVALVTGAASGIGRATALRLAEEGALVAVADLDDRGARATAEEIGADRALPIGVDVADPDSVAAMVHATVSRFGALHVLHANAAIPQAMTAVEDLQYATWRRVMAVNLDGVFLCARAAVPHLKGTRGAIVVTSSIASVRPRDGILAYAASKAGVNGLVISLALELAGAGVRVNAIAPGPLDTPFLAGMALGSDADQTVELAREASRSVSLSRLRASPPQSPISPRTMHITSPVSCTGSTADAGYRGRSEGAPDARRSARGRGQTGPLRQSR